MNVVLLEAGEIAGDGTVLLRGRRMQYARQVHGAAVGETLRVGLIGDRLGRGTITRLDDEVLEMSVVLEADPPPALPLTLVLALPRPKVLKRVLQGAASMGVKRILLANARRVEKSFWKSPALRPESVREQLLLGLEQARDTVVPEVSLHPLFKPLVEDLLPALTSGTEALVAHPLAAEPCPRSIAGPVTLAIGPEGGFIPYEVELLQAHGFRPVSLGPRILRVEQAVPALLARLF